MAKFKKARQDKPKPAVENTKRPISKKRTKKKDDIDLLSSIHKKNLKKLRLSNEIAKDVSTNMQSSKKKKLRGFKDKLDAKSTERSNVPTNCSKDDQKWPKTFQKVESNTNIKTKRKNRNKGRKQGTNLDFPNKSAARIDAKEITKLQMPVRNHNPEREKVKIKIFETPNEKKKRMSSKVEAQQVQSNGILKLNRHKINIKQLKEMLANKSQLKQKVAQLSLRDRMIRQLKASRFRFINEILYTNESLQSKLYFKQDSDAFMAYHEGYKQQVEQWAINPLDVMIASIKKLPTDSVIADFGCGEARLAASVPHTVHSFDFVALNDRVKACDMAHTPLLMNSVHVVVFCLSLMGSNLGDYIKEANRVLKNNGILKIVEVESRFENVTNFIRLLGNYGFKSTWKDLSHNMFHFMDFKKEEDISMKKKNLPPITLKSCLYKKR